MTQTASQLRRFGLMLEPPSPFADDLRIRFPDIEFLIPESDGDRSSLGIADAVLAWDLDEAELDLAPNLRWVQWVGAGVESLPLTAMEARGIVLTNNSGVHAPNISEHLLSMMLAFTRNLPALFAAQSRGEWSHRSVRDDIGEFAGSHLLIVGGGRIGSALAERAMAFGVTVTVVGRTARDGTWRINGIEEIDELLPLADHVAICLPLTTETRGLFSAARLNRMKPGARIYNIGRGPIIDTDALVAALHDGRLGGAGLDVTDPEPLPEGHPLWTAPNVLITAHTSGVTPRYWDRAFDILADNIERFVAGKPMRNLVRYELGY